MNRAQRINEQLGMPQGTAANKLRKQILFRYVQKAKHDTCFKCLKKITSVDELSIEHIEPWEGRDSDLFWSLDNIAFSHTQCNTPHTSLKGRLKRDTPAGTKWCNTCSSFLLLEKFDKHKNRSLGYASTCKQCKKKTDARPNHLKRS